MALYPPPEDISDDDMILLLSEMKELLHSLPDQLPVKPDSESKYQLFLDFYLDNDLVEKTGCEVSALSEQLKGVFGWDARTTGDGIVPITERGPAICAVHPVFVRFFMKFSSNNVLRKWIVDVANGVRKVHEKYQTPGLLPPLTRQPSDDKGPSGAPQKRARSDTSAVMLPEPKSAKADESAKPGPSKTLAPARKSAAGRKRDELTDSLVERGVDGRSKAFWKCIAKECDHQVFGNVAKDRVLKHAVKCKSLEKYNEDLYRQAIAESSSDSLGSKIRELEKETALTPPSASLAANDQAGLRQHVTTTGKLNLAPLQEAGRQQKMKVANKLNLDVNHIITRLICVRGLVPNILDSPEWHELCAKLNPQYKPPSASTFRDKFIPKEAAFVRKEMTALLQSSENLTLTMDGTTIRHPQSFYTAHATTPDRRTFFLDGHEGTDEHHDANWIVEKLQKTINGIGAHKWAAVVSDNTNVTKAARRRINVIYPHILPIWDCVHHLQNTIKDITKLETYKPIMSTLKSITKYFSKSSFATAKLSKLREQEADGIRRIVRMQRVGKTRFGTHWTACATLEPCLPAIRTLVVNKDITFKNTQVQSMFLTRGNDKYAKFEVGLLWYTETVAPLIRSLWSLEAAHANAADVFIFWLAIAATLKALFSRSVETGITNALANEVILVYNKRYAEFFQDDFYFVGFILDPRTSTVYENRQVEI